MGNHVFICYAREDQDFVLKLATSLKDRGVPVWVDQRDIPQGANWIRSISKAIDECAHFLLVLSPAAIESDDVQGEWLTALDEKKSVIPILYRECDVPPRLRILQRFDFTTSTQADEALPQLVRALGGESSSAASAGPQFQSTLPKKTHGWLSWLTMPRIRIAFSLSISFAALFFTVSYLLPRQPGGSQDFPSVAPPPDSQLAKPSPPLPVQSSPEARSSSSREMVVIPAGKFWRGCNEEIDNDCQEDEKPGREIFLDEYSIDKYEVTVEEYRRCVETKGCTPPNTDTGSCNWGKSGRERHPVNCVDWTQAEAYCQTEGKRLPTEAEWEKAARGTEKFIYPWGNEWDAEKANVGEGKGGETTPIGSYPSGKSPYGVYDMAGNVWEWVQDWYGEKYYQGRVEKNPQGPERGDFRICRGGAWRSGPRNARVSNRLRANPGLRDDRFGFRCAK